MLSKFSDQYMQTFSVKHIYTGEWNLFIAKYTVPVINAEAASCIITGVVVELLKLTPCRLIVARNIRHSDAEKVCVMAQ